MLQLEKMSVDYTKDLHEREEEINSCLSISNGYFSSKSVIENSSKLEKIYYLTLNESFFLLNFQNASIIIEESLAVALFLSVSPIR
jgi:hypothetical protein